MSFSVEQLKELSQKIAADPELVCDLSAEESIELRKYLNPLGNIVSAKKTYVNMGLVNWKEKYLRRLHMTALVGYLYRTLEEYEDDGADELDEKFRRESRDMSGSELESARAQHEQLLKRRKAALTKTIRTFLDRNFNYNPDHHLRAAPTKNKNDPDRNFSRRETVRSVYETSTKAQQIDDKLQSRPDMTYKYMRSHLLSTYQTITELVSTIKSIISVIRDPNNDTEDQVGILCKKYKILADMSADMKKVVDPILAADTRAVWMIDPPVDVFHQFDRYLTNHYEQLRDVVQKLYDEKADFEYAIILHDAFKTPEAAREYRIQHENEFKTEVFTIESGAVTLLGPFKENRVRVDFYNKNTEIIKRMMDQLEADHKLGKDLMEKKVKTEKKKNINQAGPDNEGLAAYSKVMNTVQELGAKKVLSREEAEKLAAARARAADIKEDYEVPDDAIQVNMFYPTTEDGLTKLAKTKFYTQAEAPLHLQEGSTYVDQYQPIRRDDNGVNYKTKVITARDGRKLEIKVPEEE